MLALLQNPFRMPRPKRQENPVTGSLDVSSLGRACWLPTVPVRDTRGAVRGLEAHDVAPLKE